MDPDDIEIKDLAVALREIAKPRNAADIALHPQQRADPDFLLRRAQFTDILRQLSSFEPAEQMGKTVFRTPDLRQSKLFGAAEILKKGAFPIRIDSMCVIISSKFHHSSVFTTR